MFWQQANRSVILGMVLFVILYAAAGGNLWAGPMGFFPVEVRITAALCMSNSEGAGMTW